MRKPLIVVAIGFAIVLAVLFGVEPLLGDAWGNFFLSRWPLTVDGFVDHALYNYEFNNPRWGQLFLVVSYHSRAFPIVLSPVVVVVMILGMLALVRGRLPRASDAGDAWLFVFLVAATLVTTPKIGALWIYRPTLTNYVYPLALQLAWLVPYRMLQAGNAPRSLPALVLAIVLGFLAGAANEHTGTGFFVAAAALTFVAWRRDRKVPLWTIAGIVALVAGYIFLLTAPGQMSRYEGLATKSSLFQPLIERGIGGALLVTGKLLMMTGWMVAVLGVGAILARVRLTRPTILLALGAVTVSLIILGTTLASPKLAARMMGASATFLVLAMGVVYVELVAVARAARWLRWLSSLIAAGMLTALLVVHIVTGLEGRQRLATILAAPKGTELTVPHYTFWRSSFLTYGDDFRSARLRQSIVEQYGLAALHW